MSVRAVMESKALHWRKLSMRVFGEGSWLLFTPKDDCYERLHDYVSYLILSKTKTKKIFVLAQKHVLLVF